jgi:tetrahydromethanopterin S-methyltransferase subunit G
MMLRSIRVWQDQADEEFSEIKTRLNDITRQVTETTPMAQKRE